MHSPIQPVQRWLIGLVLWLGLFLLSTPTALAQGIDSRTPPDPPSVTPAGAQLFELHCAGCHIGGGNIVRRGKNLKLKTLQRNQMDSIAAISEIVANGKGNMSAYKDRLTAPQIETVAAYVLEQAANNWKS